MIEALSLSIFTIEADGRPLLSFSAKKHHEAQDFCADERVRARLKFVRSGGESLCDNSSILRLRLANANERAHYREQAATQVMEYATPVFLIEIDVDTDEA